MKDLVIEDKEKLSELVARISEYATELEMSVNDVHIALTTLLAISCHKNSLDVCPTNDEQALKAVRNDMVKRALSYVPPIWENLEKQEAERQE